MKNTREVGRKLEEYILEKVKEIDPQARLSRGSGCGNDIGDITSLYFYIEAKNWNRECVTLSMKNWNHLINQMPINTQKIPLYVFRNNQNKNFVILNFEDFINIAKKSQENE